MSSHHCDITMHTRDGQGLVVSLLFLPECFGQYSECQPQGRLWPSRGPIHVARSERLVRKEFGRYPSPPTRSGRSEEHEPVPPTVRLWSQASQAGGQNSASALGGNPSVVAHRRPCELNARGGGIDRSRIGSLIVMGRLTHDVTDARGSETPESGRCGSQCPRASCNDCGVVMIRSTSSRNRAPDRAAESSVSCRSMVGLRAISRRKVANVSIPTSVPR